MMTGRNKFQLAREHGAEQVMAWRRRYEEPPPPIERDNALQVAIEADFRYDMLSEGVPDTESLAMVRERLAPLWEEVIAPALQDGRTVMVVSHGNTLRALVKQLDAVSDDDIFHLDLPTATPLLYEFDASLAHLQPHGLWADRAGVVRHGRFLVDESRVRAAQRAMRQQVSADIAYSTFRAETGEVVEPAVTAPIAGRLMAEVDGKPYLVRQTPPAYFFQE